ncbi:MAG: AAA family ATPase [Oscillatoria sp. SIO1A7]|nr:AAA family ATPase [Oscillatoria sp. SIO1A7]
MSKQRRRRGFLATPEGQKKLEARMSEKGYTQQGLADKLSDVSLDQIKKLLNRHWGRKIQRDAIEKITSFLGLEPGEIVADWYQPETPEQRQEQRQAPADPTVIAPVPDCPYRGLFAFQEEDAEFFFGREQFIEDLVADVRAKPLVAVIGPSGSGKSSVVFAGLMPKLRQDRSWQVAFFRPNNRPFYGLAQALVTLLEPETSEMERLAEAKKLAGYFQDKTVELRDVVEKIVSNSPGSRLLLVADQFEELYALCQDASDRQQFLDELLAAMQALTGSRSPDLALVLTLRADFLGQALSYRPFADALQGAIRTLGPMSRQELRDVIEKPAAKVGVKFEEWLSDRILEEASEEPGHLPLVEFTLTQLWEKQQNKKLTHEAYDAIGSMAQALTYYAEKVYGELTAQEQQQARQIFSQLVHSGENTRDTRRLATRAEVGEENWGLVRGLADKRLLVTGRYSHPKTETPKIETIEVASELADKSLVLAGGNSQFQEETVEIVHEILIWKWERLKSWIDEDREFLIWQQGLRPLVRQWQDNNKDKEVLLREPLLEEAEKWLAKYPDLLGDNEKAFIEASRQQKKSLRQAELSQIQQILILVLWSQAPNPRRDRLWILAAIVEAGRKLQKIQAPSDNTYDWTMEALRQVIYKIQERNRFQGQDGGVRDLSFSPDGQIIATASEDKTAKLWSLDGKELQTVQGHSAGLTSVSFSPDGQTIATASEDKTAKLWSLDGTELQTFQGHSDTVTSVSFSPDGKTIATASKDKTVKLWSLEGKELQSFEEHIAEVNCVSFSPDGKVLASAGEDKTVKLWNPEDSESLNTLRGHEDAIASIGFSPNSSKLVSGSADTTIKVWSLDGKELDAFKGHNSAINSVSFSPDGRLIASASDDKTIKIWRIALGIELDTFEGHDDRIWSVSFSPQGRVLASASADRTVRLWKLDSRELQTCDHEDEVWSVSCSPKGEILASASDDGIIKIWNWEGKNLKTFQGHDDWISCLRFSPDGFFVSASGDGTVKLWQPDGTLRQTLQTLPKQEDEILAASFSPDGRLLATASADGTIKIWNVEGKELQTFQGHSDRINSVCFSPDSKRLASASDDRAVKLWDINYLNSRSGGAEINEIKTFSGHSDRVNSVCFIPGGQMLASASDDKTVRIWNRDGTTSQILEGHSDRVLEASFSEDGYTLASASADKTVKLWSCLNWTLLATLRGHSGQVRSVCFRPDGLGLASASEDKTVKLWKLESIDLQKLVEAGDLWLQDYLKTNPEPLQRALPPMF